MMTNTPITYLAVSVGAMTIAIASGNMIWIEAKNIQLGTIRKKYIYVWWLFQILLLNWENKAYTPVALLK